MSSNKLTGELILRAVYSEADEALKTTIANTNFAVALNHEENDSVFAVKRSVIVEASSTVDAKGYSSVCLYSAGTLEVSPSDSGEDFITVAAAVGAVVAICARRVRVSVKAVMNG